MNRKPAKKKKITRQKSCYFTKNDITYIDYKDTELLKKFISLNGRILGSQITGTKPKYQKMVSKAIKRARFMGLFPYIVQKERKLSRPTTNKTTTY